MSPTKTPAKTPARKRNLAAKALRSPLFRPKVVGPPPADKRKRKYRRNPLDEAQDDD